MNSRILQHGRAYELLASQLWLAKLTASRKVTKCNHHQAPFSRKKGREAKGTICPRKMTFFHEKEMDEALEGIYILRSAYTYVIAWHLQV